MFKQCSWYQSSDFYFKTEVPSHNLPAHKQPASFSLRRTFTPPALHRKKVQSPLCKPFRHIRAVDPYFPLFLTSTISNVDNSALRIIDRPSVQLTLLPVRCCGVATWTQTHRWTWSSPGSFAIKLLARVWDVLGSNLGWYPDSVGRIFFFVVFPLILIANVVVMH